MKRRNQNRPSPFPGRMSYEATKPGFSFVCVNLFVVVYFVMDADLLFCVCLTFSVLSQEIGWEERKRLRNDLFCVRWDVKPQLNPEQGEEEAEENRRTWIQVGLKP